MKKKMLLLDNKIHQFIGGNAARINAKKINSPSELWKNDLPVIVLRKFEKKAGWFNRFFDYR